MKPIGLSLFLACVTNIFVQDWPQYLGPERNSVSSQKDVLKSWPEAGPDILWTMELGIGFGGPLVQDGKIMWKTKRDPTFMRGSMILADGVLFAIDGEQTLYLIEPNPSEFKALASAELLFAIRPI